jgi:hypothetical protein
MLAEVFLLRLEAMARVAVPNGATRSGGSDLRFVPVALPIMPPASGK